MYIEKFTMVAVEYKRRAFLVFVLLLTLEYVSMAAKIDGKICWSSPWATIVFTKHIPTPWVVHLKNTFYKFANLNNIIEINLNFFYEMFSWYKAKELKYTYILTYKQINLIQKQKSFIAFLRRRKEEIFIKYLGHCTLRQEKIKERLLLSL